MVDTSPAIKIRKLEIKLPEFPKGMTSFGGASVGDRLFVVGGKSGRAHQYARSYQNREVLMLDTASEHPAWRSVGENLGLQGLALVAHRGKLVRIGGLEARNQEGEDQDLHSTNAVKSFDPETGQWSDLPALPEPRSSMDASLSGNTVHVMGGWNLAGDDESTWATTRLELDLNHPERGWKSIDVPFRTRALAVCAHRDRIYAIGGITESGGTTNAVHVLDPATGQWSDGPEVPINSDIDAFGCSALSVGGQLLVTGYDGQVYALSDDGKQWQAVHELDAGRFFHQMLPLGSSRFTLVGGSHMEYGSQLSVDVYQVETVQ